MKEVSVPAPTCPPVQRQNFDVTFAPTSWRHELGGASELKDLVQKKAEH